MKKKKNKNKLKWSSIDMQNFRDRNFLKALTIPKKKKLPPDKTEWD